MGNLAIRVDGLGKQFRVGHQIEREDTFVRAITSALKAPFRSMKQLHSLGHFNNDNDEDVLWALRDVSFDVAHGEVIGIVGHNGAGKSTLLKILSRITPPSRGFIDLYGRVASLLEVGTGFHPELTGRENIFLNGTILGMSRAEIKRSFDAIIDFSGVERFLDTPVKRYSSGMKVRLAFAVAAHLQPEILLVDEVLAVGDAEFQKKCMGKMDAVARGGRTVLFVSHDMTAVQALCRRTVLLKNGTLVDDGDTTEVLKKYLSGTDAIGTERQFETGNKKESLVLKAVRIRDERGYPCSDFSSLEPVRIEMDVLVNEWHPSFKVGIDLDSEIGIKVLRSFHNDTENTGIPITPNRVHTFVLTVPPRILNSGRYSVSLGAAQHKRGWIFREERAIQFSVRFQVENPGYLENHRAGVVAPMLDWTINPHGLKSVDHAMTTPHISAA